MIRSESDYLLFIEPKNKKTISVEDEVLLRFKECFSNKVPIQPYYKGIHSCICGEISTKTEQDSPI